MKTADADVEKYLGMFTFLKKDQITELMNQHQVKKKKERDNKKDDVI